MANDLFIDRVALKTRAPTALEWDALNFSLDNLNTGLTRKYIRYLLGSNTAVNTTGTGVPATVLFSSVDTDPEGIDQGSGRAELPASALYYRIVTNLRFSPVVTQHLFAYIDAAYIGATDTDLRYVNFNNSGGSDDVSDMYISTEWLRAPGTAEDLEARWSVNAASLSATAVVNGNRSHWSLEWLE
jgi:hypothetical protein